MKKIKVLSLFDGISCARVALDRLGYKDVEYYASEIDKYAMQVSAKNWPEIKQVGDVERLERESVAEGHAPVFPWEYDGYDIDLLIGGSPCQDLSIAKNNRKGLSGERSGLFFEYVRILKEVNPKYFVLENVASMPKEAKEQITEIMGVEPIMINAALVSAQNRKRLFWTNIPGVTQPEDRGIMLKDVLEEGVVDREKSYAIDANYFKGGKIGGTHQSSTRNYTIRIGQIGKGGQGDRIYSPEGKSVNLSANGGGRGAKTGLYMINPKMQNFKKNYDKSVSLTSSMYKEPPKIVEDTIIRKLTPIECERLQSLPDNYTEGISNSQRYKVLGNAFNVEVVKHILSFIK
jgi:DNA (cytosine-5)-methyltransferase 3A